MSFNKPQMVLDLKAEFEDLAPDKTAEDAASGVADAVVDNYTADDSKVMARQTTSSQTISDNTATTIVFETEDQDVGDEYDHATGIFTAAAAGSYVCSWGICTHNVTWPAGKWCQAFLCQNDSVQAGSCWRGHRWSAQAAHTGRASSVGSGTVDLAEADTLRVKIQHTRGGDVGTYNHGAFTFFHIHRIS